MYLSKNGLFKKASRCAVELLVIGILNSLFSLIILWGVASCTGREGECSTPGMLASFAGFFSFINIILGGIVAKFPHKIIKTTQVGDYETESIVDRIHRLCVIGELLLMSPLFCFFIGIIIGNFK